MRSAKLSESQVAALIRAHDARHDGGAKIPAQTAAVLERRRLVRTADKPGNAQLGLGTGCWYATREGSNYLAVHGYRFTWGKVRHVHRIATYAIVESDRRKPDNVPDEDWTPRVSFHPYHLQENGSWLDTSHSYGSLDEALVSCVVWRHVERRHGLNAAMNERATGYIMNMIEAQEDLQ